MKEAAANLKSIIGQALPLLLQIDEETSSIKSAGKWSFKEIIGHLVDSASNNHQKFIRTVLDDGHHFPGYEQDDWVLLQNYQSGNWKEILTLWFELNQHLSRVIEKIPVDSLSHKLFINEKGPFTLKYIITDYNEHLKHHLTAILPGEDFLNNNFDSVY
jgi:hypothetical protein